MGNGYCCACVGTCTHTGPHLFCNDHDGGTRRRYNPGTWLPPCPSCTHKDSQYQEAHAKWARVSDENAALRAEVEQLNHLLDQIMDAIENAANDALAANNNWIALRDEWMALRRKEEI